MRFYDYDDKTWVIDIEADSLDPTQVWCLCAVNVRTAVEVVLETPEAIKAWIGDRLAEGCVLVGHNVIGYDAYNLNRLVGTSIGIGSLVDTQVLGLCYNPSLEGGHSLGAWGKRLKYPKGEFNDFSHLSPSLVAYCLQDCRLTVRVYLELIERLRNVRYAEVSLDIEHRAWQLIQLQRRNGFPFDIAGAHVLYATLRGLENEIRDELHKFWPPTLECTGVFKGMRKKDGSPSTQYLRHQSQYVKLEATLDGGYRAYEYVAFNIGSPDQRAAKLLELGWEPALDERTPTGKPKPTVKGHLVPSLVAFVEKSGRPEPALIARWMEINARANMINTWMEAYNEGTRRIHGSLWMANTLRYTHSNPNTANIPAVRVGKEGQPLLGDAGVFTYEARDLWTTSDPEYRRLVGVDAKGIQLRVLAHYLNNPAFTEALLGGDPHTYNQEIGGFSSRSVAKTFIYAYLLGAGDAKVGQIIGATPKEGKEVKARFLSNFPGLKELMDFLERQVHRTGRITLCDGARVIVTQPHARLGYLLQGDESRIMKKAMLLTFAQVRKRRLDVIKVGDIHDEHQYDALMEHIDVFKNDVCPTAFSASGKYFNYRVPIECSVQVGLTWANTH